MRLKVTPGGKKMVPDTKAIVRQIDEAIKARAEARARSKYDDLSDLKEGLAELVTLLADVI